MSVPASAKYSIIREMTLRDDNLLNISGTLQEYDVEILYRSGKAGVQPALDVLNYTTDKQLRLEISQYLNSQAHYNDIAHIQSLESFLARETLTAAGFTPWNVYEQD